MYKQMRENQLLVLAQIIGEFDEDLPTTFVEADFEVQFMKIGLALKNKTIDVDEYVILSSDLETARKLWKKLNDVE